MRLLVWNIQFFTQSRIHNTTVTGRPAEDLDNDQRALARLLYITSTVSQADPDVFVVLEVRSGQGNIAELASGEGPTGLLFLLEQLRALSDQWYLVPPLRVNPREQLATSTYTEAVGVFWRNDRVGFTGPYVWPAARRATGPPVVVFSEPSAPYPSPWDNAVPSGMVFAPKVRFYSDFGREVILADPESSTYGRRPVLTTFYERTGKERKIRLFSVHTKPSEARPALMALGTMKGPDWYPEDNEVTVFAGDFNVNMLTDKTAAEAHDIERFKAGGREQIPFYPYKGGLPPSVFYSSSEAEPTAYLKNTVYDYGFVTYGPGAQPDPLPAVRAVVADRVAGVTPGGVLPAFDSDMRQDLNALGAVAATRLVQIAAPPDGAVRRNKVSTVTTVAPHGLNAGDRVTIANVKGPSFRGSFKVDTVPSATTFTYAQDKSNAKSGNGSVDVRPRLNTFRLRWNYGHIGPPIGEGTSDHLPILLFV